jgi:hypothetical protein
MARLRTVDRLRNANRWNIKPEAYRLLQFAHRELRDYHLQPSFHKIALEIVDKWIAKAQHTMKHAEAKPVLRYPDNLWSDLLWRSDQTGGGV